MNPQEMEEAFRRTLDDRRFSTSEKRALAAVLAELAPDERQLAVFRNRAFELAREALVSPEAHHVLDWLEQAIKVLQPRTPTTQTAEACFSPEHDCPARINRLFAEARQTVDVCVFTITDDRISSAILAAQRRGVALRIITDNDKALDAGSDIDRLRTAGIPVRVDRSVYHMHHKFAIFDGALLLNGSYNWTRGAAEHNKENFLCTRDPRLLADFAQAFERLWHELQ